MQNWKWMLMPTGCICVSHVVLINTEIVRWKFSVGKSELAS